MAQINKPDYEIYLGGYNNSKSIPRNIVLNTQSVTLYRGDEYTFEYTVIPSDAMYLEVEWSSADPSIASIDDNGHVIANKQGKTIITLRIDKLTTKAYVIVKEVIQFEDPMVKKIMVRNYDTDGDGEISYTEALKVTNIAFPMFTGMPIHTFDELQYFTNVRIIGQHAFDSCSYLTSIKFPSNLTTIGKNAFSYCDSLEEITITPNVQTIGIEAFSYCDNFTTAYVDSNIPPKNGNEIFKNCPSLQRIIVPDEYTDDYLTAVNWGVDANGDYLYYSYIIVQCFDYTFDFFLS